jgi:hypothetical protein
MCLSLKNILLSILLGAAGITMITGCGDNSPERVFGLAVLNVNMMHGFAGDAMFRQLESPSVKMVAGNPNKTEPMTRMEVVQDKIRAIGENFEKLKSLRETDDTRGVLAASKNIYEYVLPVYSNEYSQLARLYDENAPQDSILGFARAISDKYYPGFQQLHEKLTLEGKAFAEKHGIQVNWDVRTSPR